ncbi:MAG: hypothetical protein IKM82_08665, partial [Oscillospiraceae bacterium]|nr:hypothetical protein [Oscillospiraceae bacterium]
RGEYERLVLRAEERHHCIVRRAVLRDGAYKGKVFNVEPPFFVELEVTETDPGFAGNIATNATKPATVETGAEIKVPLFIERGERIKIDTRTGEYLSRA